MEKDHVFTLKEASEKLGVSTNSLRWTLDAGLVPHVRRNLQGHRVLEPWQIDLLQILLGMKQAGFTKNELRRYSRLFREGKHTEGERLAMLTTRKHQLWHEIFERQKAIDFIERQEEIAQQKKPRSRTR